MRAGYGMRQRAVNENESETKAPCLGAYMTPGPGHGLPSTRTHLSSAGPVDDHPNPFRAIKKLESQAPQPTFGGYQLQMPAWALCCFTEQPVHHTRNHLGKRQTNKIITWGELPVILYASCRSNAHQNVQACLRPEAEEATRDVDYLLSTWRQADPQPPA